MDIIFANMSKHVVTFMFVCKYVKARRTIDMICGNVSKHVDKFIFPYIFQNTPYN